MARWRIVAAPAAVRDNFTRYERYHNQGSLDKTIQCSCRVIPSEKPIGKSEKFGQLASAYKTHFSPSLTYTVYEKFHSIYNNTNEANYVFLGNFQTVCPQSTK